MAMRSNRPPKPGSFVWTFDEPGLGQISSIQDGRCTVSFFKSANESFEHDYDLGKVESANLPLQTRVFMRASNGEWLVGRVLDSYYDPVQDVRSYQVRFPNRYEEDLPESELLVRCFLPIDDPADVLASGGMETQYFHDHRQSALRCLSESRAANYGLTGLLSASVELLSHQVDVVRRVLNDNLQRYLLADEVGLGKTIEACAIIRQAIFDNPEEKVVLIVPAALVVQWTRELSWRFFVQSPEHNVRIIPYEKLDSIDPSDVDTLVIDEAHNLISDEPSSDSNYQAIELLSMNAHRLLLISATPVLGNEKTLLALLHLLDPQNYQLDSVDEFLNKVKNSREFGRLLLALNPNQPAVFLSRTLDQISGLTPSDDISGQLVIDIKQSISDGNASLTSEYVRDLHRHISETYRIHQRLIRTRRRDLTGPSLLHRNSVLTNLQEDEDDRSPILVELLEQWRTSSLVGLQNVTSNNDSDYEIQMVERYARLHEALGISVEECAAELREQLANVKDSKVITFDNDEEELEIAIEATEQITEDTRLDMAASVVLSATNVIRKFSKSPKIVVFGSSTKFVNEVADKLYSQRLDGIFRIDQHSDEDQVLDALNGFGSSEDDAILLCDRRGEEGLNLQFAHGIVHLDLPLAPERIEQRIGRLDRVGRNELSQNSPIYFQEIYHWVLSPYSEGKNPWMAWHDLLRNGFKVFEQSISEVEFLLDDLRSKVKLALYRRGSEGLDELISEVVQSIMEEQQRLDEQYALDSRSIIAGDAEDAFLAIQRTDTPLHFKPLNHWFTEVLQFGRFSDDVIPAAFKYQWTERTLLPKQRRREIVVEKSFDQKLTYIRSVAAGRRGLRLVRPGLDLVDQIEDYLMKWDDRGTAFATWKRDPRWSGNGLNNWIGFRFVFSLEANVEAALSELGNSMSHIESSSLRRRMDSLLPPWMTTIDVDIEMKPVTDPLLREILDRPYSDGADVSGHRDFNLSSRRDALYDVIGFNEMAAACQTAKETSESLLRESNQFQEWAESHAGLAIEQISSDNVRLDRRQQAIVRETGQPDSWIDQDMSRNRAISRAMRDPLVRLDSIGLFIVSDVDPME